MSVAAPTTPNHHTAAAAAAAHLAVERGEAGGVAVHDGKEEGRVARQAAKALGHLHEALELAVVLGADLLERRAELQALLAEDQVDAHLGQQLVQALEPGAVLHVERLVQLVVPVRHKGPQRGLGVALPPQLLQLRAQRQQAVLPRALLAQEVDAKERGHAVAERVVHRAQRAVLRHQPVRRRLQLHNVLGQLDGAVPRDGRARAGGRLAAGAGAAFRVFDQRLERGRLLLQHQVLAVDNLLVDRVVKMRHLLQRHGLAARARA